MHLKLSFMAVSTLMLTACTARQSSDTFVSDNTAFAVDQIGMVLDDMQSKGKVLNPVTLKTDGSVYYCGYADWRSGFFPGSLWQLYELTNDSVFLSAARRHTAYIEKAKTLTWHHDIGFIIECSFGNGLRLTEDSAYIPVIVEAAQSLCTRFRPAAGVLQSWDVDKGWQSERGWTCPVIIDNMMNLELLFHATRLTGDSTYYQVALSHAERTLAEQFRPDGSCYHVVDYDPETGKVRSKQTAQGYADESIWSRGQAWAIYGFYVAYAETGQQKFLDQAIRTFQMMKQHKNMPADHIPYWDMDAPNIPNEPRDASTAACMASALYAMSQLPIADAQSYRDYADSIMTSLASPAYRAKLGENGGFILMHSVGSIPHHSEIDVPLNYADYYFLEALARRKRL